jgi:hypothetical protein
MVELKRKLGGTLSAGQKSVAPGDREALLGLLVALGGESDREALLGLLVALGGESDREAAHVLIDKALLQYIGDLEITYLVESQERWYA